MGDNADCLKMPSRHHTSKLFDEDQLKMGLSDALTGGLQFSQNL